MHWNSSSLQGGSPGGPHVVRIRMRENDAVEALLGVPAVLQSLRHGSGAESSVQKETVDGSVVSAQKQGGVATARGTQILKTDRHVVLPCTNSPRSLFDVVAASRLGVECGADGSFRTIEELREPIEDPARFLFGPLANRVGRGGDRESSSVEDLEDPANDFDFITRQALASHADEIETGCDIRRRDHEPGQHVLRRPAVATDHHPSTHSNELVDRRSTADGDPVLDDRMSGEMA